MAENKYLRWKLARCGLYMWWLGKAPLRGAVETGAYRREHAGYVESESFSGRGAQQVQRPCLFEKLSGHQLKLGVAGEEGGSTGGWRSRVVCM